MKIAVVSNPLKTLAGELVRGMLEKLRGIPSREIMLDRYLSEAAGRPDLEKSDEDLLREADLMVVLGGDGTLLNAVKRVPKERLPVLGVNLGGMGFLTEFSGSQFLEMFPGILEKQWRIDERGVLQAAIVCDGVRERVYEVLNDAVITKGALSRMLNLEVRVDGEYLTLYKADGMIVSTPTGSTAHSLSSGGPIVTPDCHVIIVTPICPHTLSNRPLVIADERRVDIQLMSSSEMVGLTLDGQSVVELKMGNRVEIRKSPRTVHLVRFGYNYFDVLRTKLGWRGSSI